MRNLGEVVLFSKHDTILLVLALRTETSLYIACSVFGTTTRSKLFGRRGLPLGETYCDRKLSTVSSDDSYINPGAHVTIPA